MVQNCYISFFFSTIFLLSTIQVDAQYRSKRKQIKHRFNAGLVMGIGLSQIDGDQYTGFDKRGLRGGLKGAMFLNDRLDIVVGLLYNQKGSKFEDLSGNLYHRNRKRVIHLDYMEVPLLISFKMQKKEKASGYLLETGFSYARLINYRIEETIQDPQRNVSFNALADDLINNEFNFIASLNFFFNRHIGIGVVYTFQMNKVYENKLLEDRPALTIAASFNTDPALKIPHLRNYQLALQVVYHVF